MLTALACIRVSTRVAVRRPPLDIRSFGSLQGIGQLVSDISSHPGLLSLFEAVSLKNSQLQQAIRVGDDDLVRLLDRELEPLIAAVIDYHARDMAEIHLQLRFIGSLIREDADDRSCVQRHAAVLSILLDRYFGDDPVQDRSILPAASPVLEARIVGDDCHLNETILNSMPDRVAVLTLDYRFLYCNAAHAQWLGATPLDLVGRNFFDFIDDCQVAADIREQLDRCFAGEMSELSSPRRDFAVVTRCRAVPLRTSDGKVIGAVVTLVEEVSVAGGMAA